MMRDIPSKGERYRNSKGEELEILAVARHTESYEELVVYCPVNDPSKAFACPLPVFMKQTEADDEQQCSLEKIADAPAEELKDSDDLSQVPPMLLEFLDAETYEEKLAVFDRMKNSVTDDIIDSIAVSLDTEVEKAPIEERYRQIREILLMQEKYETTRLR
ncbi:MAG: DUF1653 domain-containing protein [Lachnospiraceae bacterium]|nr:DUF1653 domain-containing protein [Lachnospiraceae bacterium]